MVKTLSDLKFCDHNQAANPITFKKSKKKTSTNPLSPAVVIIVHDGKNKSTWACKMMDRKSTSHESPRRSANLRQRRISFPRLRGPWNSVISSKDSTAHEYLCVVSCRKVKWGCSLLSNGRNVSSGGNETSRRANSSSA